MRKTEGTGVFKKFSVWDAMIGLRWVWRHGCKRPKVSSAIPAGPNAMNDYQPEW
jgi:hypothetical protein